jgi:hypothetical protein
MSIQSIASVASVTALLTAALAAGGCMSSSGARSEPASPGYTAAATEPPMGTETAAPTGIGGGPIAPTTNTIRWDQKLSELGPKLGEKLTFTCPPNGSLDARVWGSEVYTDDSSICGAAVHAGKITPEAGGSVTIEVVVGQPRYIGSTRNGVESASYGSWGKSFVFR